MSRRRLLALAGGVLSVAALGLDGGRAPEAFAQGRRYDGRLVDAHGHVYWDGFSDVPALMRLYAQAGVDGCWLFSVPWTLAADAAGAFPDTLVPFLGEGYHTTLHPHSSYVNPEGLEGLLAAGAVRGLGEIILRHSPFQLGPEGGYASESAAHHPADDPRLIESYRLAAGYGIPVTVHQEWFFAEELERALEAAPEANIVWAHAGHGPAHVVRAMMERHPNLHADLSARTPWIGPGTMLLHPDGSLDPAWRATLEQFPERFMVGLDLFARSHYRVEYVRMMAEYYRALLGTLADEVAEQIGHGNAERLAPFLSV